MAECYPNLFQKNRRFAANSSKIVDSRSKFSSLIFIRNRWTVYKSERITHAATRRENKPHEVVKRRNARNSVYRITWIFIQNVTLFVTRFFRPKAGFFLVPKIVWNVQKWGFQHRRHQQFFMSGKLFKIPSLFITISKQGCILNKNSSDVQVPRSGRKNSVFGVFRCDFRSKFSDFLRS